MDPLKHKQVHLPLKGFLRAKKKFKLGEKRQNIKTLEV